MTLRKKNCDEVVKDGRFRKAIQFLSAAETIRELADREDEIGDAYVTLCVHAGIAAADVICCHALGYHVQGQDHGSAIAELSRVQPDGRELGHALRVLLSNKTRAEYGEYAISADQRKRAGRAAERLVEAARQRHI
ncbi:MAG TPA: hypothetical protein VHE14_07430 [Solirubrobacteraceae bacterium]|nr:hypothetical protein [Solirubrobacteraceae bacterium]